MALVGRSKANHNGCAEANECPFSKQPPNGPSGPNGQDELNELNEPLQCHCHCDIAILRYCDLRNLTVDALCGSVLCMPIGD